MQSMTIEQLRAASNGGDLVTLKGAGRGIPRSDRHPQQRFRCRVVEGPQHRRAALATRCAALNVLRDIGITVGKFDKRIRPGRQGTGRRQPRPGRRDARRT